MKADRRIDIMGIVNLTDDSFYSGSRCRDVAEAMKRMGLMVGDGADIIDIGSCSSRPGSVPVSPEEEWRRLEPVLSEIRREFPDIKVSIDTYRTSVVEKAHDLIGDFIVNDISAGEEDPLMLRTVGRLGLGYIAMHKRGTPSTMQNLTDYDDVVAEVAGYFSDFAVRAHEAGIKEWILDPGFGFAKTPEQNYALLAGLGSLQRASEALLPPPSGILVGVSRKSMIYRPLDITPEDSLPATQAVHMAALVNGADILRVHDVREAKQTAALYKMAFHPTRGLSY